MARDTAWSAEFHRRMEEYDSSRGIGRADAAPLRPVAEPSRDLYGIEERTREAWARSPELRAEFGSYECYLAYSRAEAKGLVRILGGAGGRDV
jgi:hypothetical protein